MKNIIISIDTLKAIFDSLEEDMKNLKEEINAQDPEFDSVSGFYNSDYTCDLLFDMDNLKDLWDSFTELLDDYEEEDCVSSNIDPYWEPELPVRFDPLFGILL